MKLTIPLIKYTELDLSDEASDNLILDILYNDYQETWKYSENKKLVNAIKYVFKGYSGQNIEDMRGDYI